MADGVVYTGFDPEFGDRLNRLLALAKGEGYTPNLISGRRDAYGWPGMKGQSQAELYSQLGKPGGPRAAAPPGYSPHQYGVAGDVTGLPQSELERLSSEVGLRTIHNDPNHVELPSWQQEAATQPPPTPWSETNPANVPSRNASNVAAAPGEPLTSVPGKTLNSISTDRMQTTPAQRADWYRNYIETTYPGKDPNLGLGIAKAEGLNAPGIGPSRVDVDPQTGQPFSFGDFQYNMHPGALGSQVLAAGLDPRDPNLWQQTGKWALDQIYGKNNVAPWKGDPVAAAYLKTGAAPPSSMPPGSASPPPSGGRGPIGSDAVAGGTAGEKAPMTAQDWIKKATTPGAGGKDSPLKAGLAGMEKALGGGDDQGQQAQQQAQNTQAQQLQAQQAAAAYGAQRQQSLAANASQMMAHILAQGKKPLSWGSAPPGAAIGPSMGVGAGQLPPLPQAQGVSPSMPDEMLAQLMQQGGSMGTSLNSTGDFYG